MPVWIVAVLGIGCVLIGIGLLAIAGILFKLSPKINRSLDNMQKTTETLPEKMDGITSQVTDILGTGADTLHEVNKQIKELSPLFYLVGDAGRATRQLAASVLKTANDVQEKAAKADLMIANKNLQGIYGLATIGYVLINGRKNGQQG